MFAVLDWNTANIFVPGDPAMVRVAYAHGARDDYGHRGLVFEMERRTTDGDWNVAFIGPDGITHCVICDGDDDLVEAAQWAYDRLYTDSGQPRIKPKKSYVTKVKERT